MCVLNAEARRTAAEPLTGPCSHRGANPLTRWARSALTDSLFRCNRWELKEVFYWAQPQPFWDMPAEVVADLKQSAMVFVKGDANYRRLLGDCQWELTTPFTTVAGYFPAPLCALRTLKA